MKNNELLNPVRLNNWTLQSKVVMAPMTRSFADNETGIVGKDVVEYYRRRAANGVGLIITEGINPSPRGKGTFGVPGLYTDKQINAWQKVTDAVHLEGGTIVAQLWHVGRLSHHELTGGYAPQAPSKIKADGLVHRLRKPYESPEQMSFHDIQSVINQYSLATRNAKAAGFDGVEIHGAHGYLIDQFNTNVTNKREDKYGGDLYQRLTFMKEILHAVANEVGPKNTIIRFSEIKDDLPTFKWDNPEITIKAFIQVFKEIGLKIIHPSTNDFKEVITNEMTLHQLVRKYWDDTIIGVGNLDVDTANNALKEGTIDLASFGRPILANPDFVQRIKKNKKLTSYNSKVHLKKLY